MLVRDLQTVTHLHHAYLVPAEDREGVLAALKERGVAVAGNPDVLTFQFSDLAVDDARMIAERAFLKSMSGAKYFIISFDRAGNEAQNALLKVVEEAPGDTHFFFCTASPGALIPTLRSRCIQLSSQFPVPSLEMKEAKEFLALSYAERLAHVESLIKSAQRADDRTPLRAFARALCRAHPSRETLSAVRYLEHSGTSPKLVLSHLAVALPVVTRN